MYFGVFLGFGGVFNPDSYIERKNKLALVSVEGLRCLKWAAPFLASMKGVGSLEDAGTVHLAQLNTGYRFILEHSATSDIFHKHTPQ